MSSKAAVIGKELLFFMAAVCGYILGMQLSSTIRYSMIDAVIQGFFSPSTVLLVIGTVSLAIGIFLFIVIIKRGIRSATIWSTAGLTVVGATLLTLGVNAVAGAANWLLPAPV